MNRTERAIKKQYRQSEIMAKKKKQMEVEKMKHSSPATASSLLDRKGNAARNVRIFAAEEKECKNLTHDYKKRVLSEKKIHKEAVRV